MNQTEVMHLMQRIDSSLEQLRAFDGRLTGPEIRVQSLLTLARQELARDLIENTSPDLDVEETPQFYD